MNATKRRAALESRGAPVVSAFSVDVEDYFHAEGFHGLIQRSDWDAMELRVVPSTRRLVAMLSEFGARATFFVLGWVAERTPALVKEIHGCGHEVAVHGYDHRPITRMSRREFRDDLRRAKSVIEDAIGDEVVGYRAPTYSVVHDTLWALDVLVEEGFRYDSSIFPIVHDRYGIPDARRHPWREHRAEGSLVEFPISTVRLAGRNLPFVGGGYLRLLPMPYVRWGMRRVTLHERRPCMLYIHPWEVDTGQPVFDVGRLARVRHYGGLARVEERLRALLAEFPFDSVRSVLGL